MIDFESARARMVDSQLRTTDVTSHSLLSAFLTVPREAFVPEKLVALAYIDSDLEIASAADGQPPRFLMEPSPLGKLLQAAEIGPDDSVLDVGAGTGYASAIISRVAKSVVALECDDNLVSRATVVLAEQGFDNVSVVKGSLEKGYASEAPFDVIFLNGAVEVIPDALFDQLRDGGRLIAVVGYGNASAAQIYVREGASVSKRFAFNTSVRPLPGFRKVVEFVF
jgi:protein-L-isoaspartate(D-aspartate) O-methyltransferase